MEKKKTKKMQRNISFDTYEEFKRYLDEYERQTTSHFITVKKEKKFSQSEWKGKRLHWMEDSVQEDTSIPYAIIGHLLLGCHQGKDKNTGKKEKYRQSVAEKRKNPEVKIRHRLQAQSTKKLDCPALIHLTKVATFPGFRQQATISKWMRRKVITEFYRLIKEEEPVEVSFAFCAKFPALDAHRYHVQGEFGGMREPVHPRVRSKVADLVRNGVTNVPDIQEVVRGFVAEEIFPNETPPSEFRRRYNPTKQDIINISYTVRKKQRSLPKKRKKAKGKSRDENEQDLLRNFAPERKLVAADDLLFLHFDDNDESSDEEAMEAGDGSQHHLLFCYQTQTQQRLLGLYSSLLVLDIPKASPRLPGTPVFLYVRTNVDFQLVAAFVVKHEEMETGLARGLRKVRQWNPGWKPEFVLMDMDKSRIDVVERVFQESDVFVSTNHIEKLMRDWLAMNESDKRATKVAESVFLVAAASTVEQCEKALTDLQALEAWEQSDRLQTWFTGLLEIQQSWVAAFRPAKLSILLNAMNGAEKLAELMRTDLLKDHLKGTLYSLIKVLVNKIVPPFYKRYVLDNIRGSSSYGKLHKSLPQYLENRPLDLVNHFKAQLPIPQTLIASVEGQEDGTYTVQAKISGTEHSASSKESTGTEHSASSKESTVVNLGDESSMPSCQCRAWMQQRLPCQHMLAVFQHVQEDNPWNRLSPEYRDNPVFMLDLECIAQQMVCKTVDIDPTESGQVLEAIAAKTALRNRIKLDLAPAQDVASGERDGHPSEASLLESIDGHQPGPSALESSDGQPSVTNFLESIAFELIAKATDSGDPPEATGGVVSRTGAQTSRGVTLGKGNRSGDGDGHSDGDSDDELVIIDSASSRQQETCPTSAKRAEVILRSSSSAAAADADNLETCDTSTTPDAHSTGSGQGVDKMLTQSVSLRRHACALKIKKLTELIPRILDDRVLENIDGYLQKILDEVQQSSSS